MPAATADLQPGERIDDLTSGDAVIVIPLFGAHDLFARCLTSVVAHAPAGTTILVADDHGPDPASRRLADELVAAGRVDGRLLWLRQPENLGFVGNCNAAFAVTAPADVLLLNSDVEVAAGFFEGMREAAYSDGLIASASALANFASILSVPFRNVPIPSLPPDASLPVAAAALREELAAAASAHPHRDRPLPLPAPDGARPDRRFRRRIRARLRRGGRLVPARAAARLRPRRGR